MSNSCAFEESEALALESFSVEFIELVDRYFKVQVISADTIRTNKYKLENAHSVAVMSLPTITFTFKGNDDADPSPPDSTDEQLSEREGS